MLVYGVGVLALLALPVAGIGILVAKPVFSLVFGEEFLLAVPSMQILFGVSIITFQVWLLRIVLVAVNRQMALMCFNIGGLIVRIVADLLLIPFLGIMGAALATLLSEALLFLGIWVFIFLRVFRVETIPDGFKVVREALTYRPTAG